MMFRQVLLLILLGLTSARAFNVLTYNAYLVEDAFNPGLRETRRDKLIEALNSSDADLICLQEAFLGQDVEAIVNGVNGVFPYSFSKIHNKDGTVDSSLSADAAPVCEIATLSPLMMCIVEGCAWVTSMDEAFNCTMATCQQDVTDVITSSSEECLTCFLVAFPDVSFIEGCAGLANNPTLRKVNTPGLLMLSRKRLRKPKFKDFFRRTSDIFVRGYLSAKIDGTQPVKNLLAVCTHLSAMFDIYLEPMLSKRFSSYEEQNRYEIKRLVRKFGKTKKTVLLGDFNVGPAGQDGIEASAVENYQKLNRTFNTQIVDNCTHCPSPANMYNSQQDNYILDHVFTKGLAITLIGRAFTPDQSTLDFNGKPVPLSYHEGVQATIRRRRNP